METFYLFTTLIRLASPDILLNNNCLHVPKIHSLTGPADTSDSDVRIMESNIEPRFNRVFRKRPQHTIRRFKNHMLNQPYDVIFHEVF